MGYPAEFLPRMYITDMHFDHRRLYSGNSIPDGHGCMRVTARVKDNPITGKPCPLQFVDQFPFYIALKITEDYSGIFPLQTGIILLKSIAAIHFGFPGSQQVQIRAVDDGYLHGIAY